MEKITYKDIMEKLLKKFNITMHLEKISDNKLMLKFQSKKYEHIWIDCDEFCMGEFDNIYIKYDKTEDVNSMIYDILFDHIKTFEKYHLMCRGKNNVKLLFLIPQFNSEEELALKMELVG